MNRVILINKTKSPTREELVTSERQTGELMFAPQLDNIRFAGYVIVEGRGIKAANWIIPDDKIDGFLAWAKDLCVPECPGYEIAVYRSGVNRSGGQTEIRAL